MIAMKKVDLLKEDGARSILGIDPGRLENKTILITGASGLVGTGLLFGLVHLLDENLASIRIDAVVGSGIPWYFSHFRATSNIYFHEGNLINPSFIESLPGNFDIIFHAATYGQPGMFMQKPLETIALNTSTLMSLFEKLSPEGKLLFLSSSEIYSGLSSPPFNEDQIGLTNTTHPRACYIEAKRTGEAICNVYRSKGVDAKSIRLALAYGPGTRTGDKRVLNALIEKGIRQRCIRLFNWGSTRRTYCYISDAVNMMWNILLEGRDPVYNVGGRSTIRIIELANMIGKILNVPVIAGEGGSITGAPDDVQIDISKYIDEFGAVDFIGLEVGLPRTIGWQRIIYDE